MTSPIRGQPTEDPLERAVLALTPDARAALRRGLLAALGRPDGATEVLAADLVNTEAEVLDVSSAAADLATLVARAAQAAQRAPVVRVDGDDGYALLTSPQHLWRLVDRVNELEVAIHVLATFCVRDLAQAAPMEQLLELLDG
jgi:uncharacterized protein with PhoU and TrkA domain